jgi:hypothetical protein
MRDIPNISHQLRNNPFFLSKIHFNIIHNLHLSPPSGLLPSVFPTNILYAFLFSPFVLHALPTSSFLTDYEDHHQFVMLCFYKYFITKKIIMVVCTRTDWRTH